MVAGLVLLALLTYPIGVLGLLAYSAFTGCFLSCRPPQTGTGLAWSAIGAVLLALPLAVGLGIAGARSRRAWWSAAALVLVVVAGWDLAAVLAR